MNRPGHRRAFSLVELIVVVAILGVLLAIIAPFAMQSQQDSLIAATTQHLKAITLAAEVYRNEQGAWPADGGIGVIPANFVGHLRPDLFAVPCPLGGAYDWDQDVAGIAASLKVVGISDDNSAWQVIDRQIDDGDLATGNLRLLSDAFGQRILWVLEN